jgi:hypothetical protein
MLWQVNGIYGLRRREKFGREKRENASLGEGGVTAVTEGELSWRYRPGDANCTR